MAIGDSVRHARDMEPDWNRMTLAEVKAVMASIFDARDGDYRRLEQRLRDGAELHQEERRLLAERHSRNRTPGRPKIRLDGTHGLKKRALEEFMSIAARESGWPDKAIVAEARGLYGISRTEAYDALKKVKPLPSK